MIVITGGAGFIGSALVWRLNQAGKDNIVIVDELGKDEKWKNLTGLNYLDYYNKHTFLEKIEKDSIAFNIEAIIHMGANSATTEKDADHLMSNNYEYTKKLAAYAVNRGIRFIYASSAATYGDGSKGFNDVDDQCTDLRPLNMYGYSKSLFDIRAFKKALLTKIVGIKFFNVFGPNEYHKGDMRSVVHKAFQQIQSEGKITLFKSYHPDYKDGEQKRDFIYVKDAVDMTLFFLQHPEKNGLYNVGTGTSRTWNDLANAIFTAMGKKPVIEYIDMPEYLRSKYQYYTEANISKLQKAGYSKPALSLEAAVDDYVKNYLLPGKHLDKK
ncbi:MAG: ADP-glyceromanno-heptose 6-epimerase [Ignavibacteria bacterium]|nr:ADP-glyceromanno-heptose 6-epimerase [Ignavibacteria bacterium]